MSRHIYFFLNEHWIWWWTINKELYKSLSWGLEMMMTCSTYLYHILPWSVHHHFHQFDLYFTLHFTLSFYATPKNQNKEKTILLYIDNSKTYIQLVKRVLSLSLSFSFKNFNFCFVHSFFNEYRINHVVSLV